jgi:hypothetical protein
MRGVASPRRAVLDPLMDRQRQRLDEQRRRRNAQRHGVSRNQTTLGPHARHSTAACPKSNGY